MSGEKVKVTVRLPRDVHTAVRTRAFREGATMDELGRWFFERYAEGGRAAVVNGGLAGGAGVVGDRDVGASSGSAPPVRPSGLAAGPSQAAFNRDPGPGEPPATMSGGPAASPSFKPDPKKGKK